MPPLHNLRGYCGRGPVSLEIGRGVVRRLQPTLYGIKTADDDRQHFVEIALPPAAPLVNYLIGINQKTFGDVEA